MRPDVRPHRAPSPGTCAACLAELDPLLWERLESALFRPRYPFAPAVAQLGLSIDVLRQVLADRSLQFLPGVPPNAVRARQLAFVAGRLCAEQALLQLGAGWPGPIGQDAAGAPLWPSGWTGSIAHTGQWAFAAAARRASRFDLGIDAEPIVDHGARLDILAECAQDSELAVLDGQPDNDLAATVLFSAKEAYYKAVYRCAQRFIGFKEIRLVSLNLSSGKFEFMPSMETKHDLSPASGRFTVANGMVLTCVSPGPADTILFRPSREDRGAGGPWPRNGEAEP